MSTGKFEWRRAELQLIIGTKVIQLMSNHTLMDLAKSFTLRFCFFNYPSHLYNFVLTQLDIATSPILLQSLRFRRSNNWYQVLTRNPRQCKLRCGTSFLLRQGLDFLHNCLVLIEGFTLELWNCSSEIIWCEIVWRGIVEIID